MVATGIGFSILCHNYENKSAVDFIVNLNDNEFNCDDDDNLDLAQMQRDIRHTLTYLLSRREYSAKECRDKCSEKGYVPEIVDDILLQFQEKGIQSDARFCISFIRNAINNKGQGWQRIQQSLSQHNLDPLYIEEALTELAPDWFELAYQCKVKRFSAEVEKEPKAKMKQMRFLQYRGFSYDEINHAIEFVNNLQL